MLNRRGTLASLTGGLMASLLSSAAGARTQNPAPPTDPAEVLPLWPGDPPGAAGVTAVETVLERGDGQGPRDRAVTHTRKPTLTVFRPAKPNGAAVVLMPGGGYERVVVDKEGFETARWLADRGYTCFVLLYRLPGDGWGAGPDAPLQDAQRAVRLVRSRAAAIGFNPARVAIMGFSAGGTPGRQPDHPLRRQGL
jgi:acetyl esterase/lipase